MTGRAAVNKGARHTSAHPASCHPQSRRSLWIVVGMMAAIAVVVVLRPDGGGGSSLRYPNPVRADTDDVTAQAIGVIQGVHGVGPLLKAPPVSVPQPGDPPQVEVPAPAKQTPAESTQQAQQQQQQPAPPAPPAPPTPQNRPQDKPQPPAQSPVQPPHNALQALPVNVSPRCAAVRPPLPKGVPVNSVLLTDAKFQAMLSRVASSNCDVIVTAGNYGFLSMLTNLVNTSIRRFQLDFFLIVGLDDRVCAALPSDVPCYTYPETFASGNFGSAAFSKLVNIKTEIVMAIAASGYNSLLVDGDIVFKKNPFTVLTPQAPLFDLQIQDDAEGGRNSGFMYTQRTALGLEFLATSLNVASRTKNMRQQPAVNAALGRMQSRLRVKVLPTSQFPCGKAYFERPRRMFAFDNPCTECVIVHDNWVVGTAAKVLRLKEHLIWLVDIDGYYSSPTHRYLEVGNSYMGASAGQELEALRAAMMIGMITNRLVILPEFRCHGCSVEGTGGTKEGCSGASGAHDVCNFMAHYSIKAFDNSFKGSYREHMVRYNPMVPSNIRLQLDIEPEGAKGRGGRCPTFVLRPEHATYGPADTVIIPSDLPGDKHSAAGIAAALTQHAPDAPVVRFAALYGAQVTLPASEASKFTQKWSTAIKKSSVRQY